MMDFERHPQLGLYMATGATFDRLAHEAAPDDHDLMYLSFKPGAAIGAFSEPGSSYEADAALLCSIERRDGSYAIGIDLSAGGTEYVRPRDSSGPHAGEIAGEYQVHPHVVVTSHDGPPALMHNEYFGSIHNTVSDLPPLLAADYAEIVGPARAAALIAALGTLTLEQVDREWLM
jgi:hypothetical protein